MGLAFGLALFSTYWKIMYPLSVSLPAPLIGFALANDASEHKTLSDAGYVPAYVAQDTAYTLETARAAARAALDKAGIEYDKRLGLAKLIELIK
jgi:hypothetical protein